MAVQDIMPILMAKAVMVLRESAVMPRLVSRNYATSLASVGKTVNVKVTKPRTAQSVTPSNVPSGFVNPDPTTVPVTLDQFFHDGFSLDDDDITGLESNNDYVPAELEQCVRSVTNRIDTHILQTMAAGVYGRAGVAGTTPFLASLAEAQAARRVLAQQLCPLGQGGLSLVMDVDAYNNALGLPVLQRVNESGASETLREGRVTRALGFNWFEDQNVYTHTAGASGTILVNNVAGYNPVAVAPNQIRTIVVDNGAGAVPPAAPIPGDMFTIAGHTQQYVVIAYAAGNLTFSPNLKGTAPDNAALTFLGNHKKNFAFHESSVAFASRLQTSLDINGAGGAGNVIATQQVADPVSGVALRLELIRGYKQIILDVDALWGTSLVQPECAAVVLG
jgi:hypothetical protein